MKSDRKSEVDMIRGLALFGICVVNVPFLGLPLEAALLPPETPSGFAVAFLVALLFQGKFFVLFSFLFGWGFSIQIASAERTGTAFGRRYFRRLLGLFIIGIAHALLVFVGDILVLYALLGIALYPLRNLPPRRLMWIAACFVAMSVLTLAILAIVIGEGSAQVDLAPSPLGSFMDVVRLRAQTWPFAFGFILLFNGPIAFAAFCAGLAAAKVRFFEPGSQAYDALKRQVPFLLAAGLLFNLGYALATSGVVGEDLLTLFGFMGLAIGGPCLASVYLVAVVELSRHMRYQGTATRAAGRMSLTAYIGEGILAGLLFNGYGFALFDQLGHLELLGIATAIYAIVHVFAAIWLRWFRRGPFEALLRKIA